jgi:hypothetical protein
MVAVHTFVTLIKNYLINKKYMAEDKKDKKTVEHKKGGISFGFEVLLFVLAIFVIWVLMGGAKKTTEEKPFITPLSDQINPGMKYGPEDVKNNSNINYQQPTDSLYESTDTTN